MSKTWLKEVSFMRPVLLVLLVSYHAFAPYVGSWKMPEGIEDIELYKWLGLLSRAFRLEGFVFISGYIFTFQLIERQKFDTLKSLFWSKFHRLIIPGIVFGFLYYVCFSHPVNTVILLLKLSGGIAHLWYLPCLFWCFLIQYIFIKKHISIRWCLPFLLLAAIISFIPMPINLNKPFYYMLFFWGGGLFWQYSDVIASYATRKNICIAWMAFFVFFYLLNIIMEASKTYQEQLDDLLLRSFFLGQNNLFKAILGWMGIIALYLSACSYCESHQMSDVIIKIGACGYGVYVFHQFILIYLYRYTTLPEIAGSYLLPWAGFIITAVVAILLTLVVRSTHLGRKYL